MRLVSFVIPCYRSALTISSVVNEVITTIEPMQEYEYEIVLVNDASPDDTFDVIRSLCQGNHKIKGIDLAKNFGQHAPLMAGFDWCKGDIIVCLDDDGTDSGR